LAVRRAFVFSDTGSCVDAVT